MHGMSGKRGIKVKQLSNGSNYILELIVPAQLEYQLTGKTSMYKKFKLAKAKPKSTKPEDERDKLIKCWMRRLENGKKKNIENWFKCKP